MMNRERMAGSTRYREMSGNAPTSLGWGERLERVLCYIPFLWVGGLFFWLFERKNRNVQRHARQSLMTLGPLMLVWWLVSFLSGIVSNIILIGWLLGWVLSFLTGIFLWVVIIVAVYLAIMAW